MRVLATPGKGRTTRFSAFVGAALVCGLAITSPGPGDGSGYAFAPLQSGPGQPEAYLAANPANGLRTIFTGAGLRLESALEQGSAWDLALEPSGWGTGAADLRTRVTGGTPNGDRFDLAFSSPALTGWLLNGANGIEQVFTAIEPPGDGELAQEAHVLRLELDLIGGLSPRPVEAGRILDFRTPAGRSVLRYVLESATAASGAKALPASLAILRDDGGNPVGISLEVDVAEAAYYPVTVRLRASAPAVADRISLGDYPERVPAGEPAGTWGEPAFLPPIHDECFGAEQIPATGPFPHLTKITTDITSATEAGDPVAPDQIEQLSRSVWYRFTPEESGLYTLSTCGGGQTATTVDDTLLAVYVSDSSSCDGSLTLMAGAWDDDGCHTESMQSVAWNLGLEAGTTYYVVVWKFGQAPPAPGRAALQLKVDRIETPVNDVCAAAQPLELDRPIDATNASARNDYELASNICFAGVGQIGSQALGRDTVFSFTAPDASDYSFRVQQSVSGADRVIYTASECPEVPPTQIVSSCLFAANRNSETGAFLASEEIFCQPMDAGEQVFLFVDEAAMTSEGGAYTVEVNRCKREEEPNDRLVDAGDLVCGIQGSLWPDDDIDYFALETPAEGGRLFAMVEGASANVRDLDLRIMTGKSTLEFDDANNDLPMGRLSANCAGTPLDGDAAFIQVGHGPGTEAREPYRLFAVVQPPIDSATMETEPNDVSSDADRSDSDYFRGSLDSPADVDLFRFEAEAGQTVFIGLDGDPGRDGTAVNVALALLDGDGRLLVSVDDPTSESVIGGDDLQESGSDAATQAQVEPSSPGESLIWRVRESGSYFARVTGASSGDYLVSIAMDCRASSPAPLADFTSLDDDRNEGVFNDGTGEFEAVPSELNYTMRLDNSPAATTITWDDPIGGPPDQYNLYRGTIGVGASFVYNQECMNESGPITMMSALDPIEPESGATFYYLLTRVDQCEESIPGRDSEANPRPNDNPCTSPTCDCDDGNPCTVDSYDGVAGACVNDPVTDGTTCDDGSLCTTGDVCTAGVCDSIPVTCSGDTCNDGVCNESTGACELVPVNDGTACDDGSDCTESNACSSGACTGSDLDCSGFNDFCNVGVCTEGVGCEAEPANEGGSCDDGDYCTIREGCSDGVCGDSVPRDCDDGNPCTVDSCDSVAGACVNAPVVDGTTCDDGDACTNLDECNAGVCGGTPLGDGSTCDDGSLCTTADVCTGGVCDGIPVSCSGDICNDGVCNEATGSCELVPANDGAACDDGSTCTELDACSNGECDGSDLNCSSFNDFCNVGVCTEGAGCEAEPANEGGSCDDGDYCTVSELCSGGVCGDAVPRDCDDGNPCTVDSCDGVAGACVNDPVVDGTTCDDGDACTNLDECNAGVCGGTPLGDGSTCDDGSLCTTADVCTGGVCDGTPVTCSGDTCNDGVCNEATGSCELIPANDGAACDDGSTCTELDACSNGECDGSDLNCSSFNDFCNVGVCTEGVGCEAEPANDGGFCDDGDFCTVKESCSGGACGDPLPRDCDDGNPCTVDSCDSVAGACVNDSVVDGTTCDDGDACTNLDECNAGVCGGTPLGDGSTCDDGSLCTTADVCTGGVCDGTPVTCSGDTCNDGVCNEATGSCELIPANDGAACDDGSTCTELDACSNGECDGSDLNCSSFNDFCNVGVCTEGVGCEAEPANDGGFCDDGDFCTVKESCSGGACGDPLPRDCDDGNPCTVDSCDSVAGACVNDSVVDGTTCDDGDACTSLDECNAGVCGGAPLGDGASCDDGSLCTTGDVCTTGVCDGIPVSCSGDTCNDGVCNEATGACDLVPANDGTVCDDGSDCTELDACSNGECAGSDLNCSSFNDFCNVGVCTEGVGCEAEPANEGGSCDDGDYCTVSELCSGGVCGDAVPRDCDDGNPCTVDSCDGVAGACVNDPVVDGTTCDDGDACTSLDECNAGVCGGAPLGDGASCDDGSLCTTGDVCTTGVCDGIPVSCSGDTCNDGVCNEATGACDLVPANDGTVCDDGSTCTELDACSNGECAGSDLNCSSFNDFCNVGVCTEGVGCEAEPANEGGSCDDGDYCTVSELCSGGVCGDSLPRDCDDGNPCTVDSCDGVAGACVNDSVVDGTTCDDGDACTSLDECNAGVCGGAPLGDGASCDDGSLCTTGDVCTTGVCDGIPVSCSGDTCNDGVCNEATGACDLVPANDGTVCDDGSDCTELDACSNGECAGSDLNCSSFNDFCNVGVCTDGVGCEAEPANEGGSCDDGDYCTVSELCSGGVCGDSLPRDCDDGNPCTVDSCDGVAGACVNDSVVDGTTCDDGDACTNLDECNAGVCGGTPLGDGSTCDDGSLCTTADVCTGGVCDGTPVSCSGDVCNDGVCNEATGACDLVPANDGTVCDDGSDCTELDACSNGECAGSDLNCSSFNDFCNVGVCTEGVGCEAEPANEGGSCDDGDYCTVSESCASGVCSDAVPRDCDDGNPCTVDSCDGVAGACVNDSVVDGTTCDDGDACTNLDECNAGVCGGTPLGDGASCDDGSLCTTGDVCTTGVCDGIPVSCSGDTCNDGVCNEATGSCELIPANDGTACDDGSTCTELDACSNGECDGSDLNCSSFNDFCNVGACTEGVGCEAEPANEGGSCDDGDYCTVSESCSGGVCGDSVPRDCDDGNPSTVDSCDSVAGTCVNDP